jgi:hypothetical protein
MEVSYIHQRGGGGERESKREREIGINGSYSTRTIRETKKGFLLLDLPIPPPPGSPHFAVCHAYNGMWASATHVSILCMHTE